MNLNKKLWEQDYTQYKLMQNYNSKRIKSNVKERRGTSGLGQRALYVSLMFSCLGKGNTANHSNSNCTLEIQGAIDEKKPLVFISMPD